MTQEFVEWESATYGIKVGCGTLFIIVDYNKDDTIHRIRIPRNSKFKCDLVMRDVLARQSTFEVRHDPSQLVKDLKNQTCAEYHVGCKARSCFDAMARTIERLSPSHPSSVQPTHLQG